MKSIAPHWLALSGAALLALGWYPPFAPLLFIGLVPLLVLEERLRLRSLWFWTILMFLGWNVGAIWWLWNASGWFTLGAWIPNAILMSLPVVLASLTRRLSDGRFRFLPFIAFWLSFEYLHQNWGLTFPWLNLGNALGAYPAWAQWYEYTGSLGGSLWLLVGNVLAYEVFVRHSRHVLALALWVLMPLGFSLYLFYTFSPQEVTPVEVVVVQPNLDCYAEKFAMNPKTGEPSTSHVPYTEQVNRLQQLAEEKITPQTRFVAFPETALHKNVEEAYLFTKQNPEFYQLQRWLQQHPDLSLITGMDSYLVYENGLEPSPTARTAPNGLVYDKFNTALFMQADGAHEFYHKSKLVIGAETTPFRSAMPVVLKDMSGSLGVQAERELFPHPTDSLHLKAAPVICFESVYGEFVTGYEGMNLIFVITNDGWWGNTPGHTQHLRFSQLRAIEMRRPVARSANTGISCFINAKGEITSSLGYNQMGALRGVVEASSAAPTLYAQHGDYLGRLAAFLALAFLLSAYIRRLRS